MRSVEFGRARFHKSDPNGTKIDENGRDLWISSYFVLGYISGKQLRDYSESKRMTKRSRGGKIVRRSAVWEKTPAAAKTAAGVMANDSNFDRNPLRGCNFGSEGGAFLILGGCSSLPKEEERLHEIMC